MKFLDQARVNVISGDGGAGCTSFRRERYVEFGGPDGGNGGRGGNVIALCVENLNTLIDFRYQQHFKAEKGIHGMGKHRYGAAGQDKFLKVPPGTQIFAEDNETLLGDLTRPGQRLMLARGGNGGFGNTHFKSSTNQAPRRANPGQEGVEREIWLRLKLIADAGILGLPNAGKSTFLAATSNARPKIADYPFTTLEPNLGVVELSESRSFVMADIPGIIEGAHDGKGLGLKFLQHIERTRVLAFLVPADCLDPQEEYQQLRDEVRAYSDDLHGKLHLVVVSKMDLWPPDEPEPTVAAPAPAAVAVYHVSSATGAGIAELEEAMWRAVQDAREQEPDPTASEVFVDD